MSPSPSPRVLPCCFIQDVLPDPLPPSYFTLIEIRKLLIGTWCILSTTVPVAVQTSLLYFSVLVLLKHVQLHPQQ